MAMDNEQAVEQERQIMDRVEQMFLTYGIKSITMDDISRDLGISKKTLYLYVSNKKDLVNKSMENRLEQDKEILTSIIDQSSNAIEEMFMIADYIRQHIRNMNPSVLYDLQKYYPQSWQLYIDYKNNFVYSIIYNNIKNGIEQGLYRNDFNIDIITKIYNTRMQTLIDPQIFPPSEYGLLEVHSEILHYHLRGIASQKGLSYLETQHDSND